MGSPVEISEKPILDDAQFAFQVALRTALYSSGALLCGSWICDAFGITDSLGILGAIARTMLAGFLPFWIILWMRQKYSIDPVARPIALSALFFYAIGIMVWYLYRMTVLFLGIILGRSESILDNIYFFIGLKEFSSLSVFITLGLSVVPYVAYWISTAYFMGRTRK